MPLVPPMVISRFVGWQVGGQGEHLSGLQEEVLRGAAHFGWGGRALQGSRGDRGTGGGDHLHVLWGGRGRGQPSALRWARLRQCETLPRRQRGLTILVFEWMGLFY